VQHMRRNSLDISADLLKIARDGAKKTQLVYRANLNFSIIKKYIERLRVNGFLVFKNGYYITTERGVRFIDQYHELADLHRSHNEMII
jgi:predicted transcriptional regulator